MNLAYKPVSMFISFIYVPVVMNYLGIEKYGIWVTLLSILSWINYFDLGIGNGLRNKLTQAMATDPDNKLRQVQLISSAYIMTSVLVGVFTIVIVFLGSIIDWGKFFGIAGKSNENLYGVICICWVCVGIGFILSLCKCVYYAQQKAHLCNLFGAIKQALILLSIYFASRTVEANLMVVAVLYGTSSILAEFLTNVAAFKNQKELIPRIKYFTAGAGRDVVSLGIKFFIIQVAGLILFTTDNLIITNLYGPEQVTYYTTVNKAFTAVITVFTTATQPYWSAIRAESSVGEIVKVKRLIGSIMKYIGLASMAAVLLFFVYRPVARIWLGQDLEYPRGIIFGMMVYAIVYIWCNGLASISNGLEIINGPMVIAVVQGVVNIPLSLFFAKGLHMGTTGVLWGTIGAMLISAVATPVWIVRKLR